MTSLRLLSVNNKHGEGAAVSVQKRTVCSNWFFLSRGLITAEIHNDMQPVYADKCFNLSAVKSWCHQFSSSSVDWTADMLVPRCRRRTSRHRKTCASLELMSKCTRMLYREIEITVQWRFYILFDMKIIVQQHPFCRPNAFLVCSLWKLCLITC